MIQQGERNIFETMIRFDAPEQKMVIGGDVKNLDGLNYLEGRSLDFVDEKAFLGTLAAHVDGGVPVITMDMGELNDAKLGEMFYFFELACGVSAYTSPVLNSISAICSSCWASPATKCKIIYTTGKIGVANSALNC